VEERREDHRRPATPDRPHRTCGAGRACAPCRGRRENGEEDGGRGRAQYGGRKAKAGQAGTNVVSHFVKDILLDNANLQHGILELREMLDNSNEEVGRLRDQLKVHQPVSSSPENTTTPTLQKELEMEAEAEAEAEIMNQELHIHHHYHGPKITKNLPKVQASRRPKKKRFSLTPTHFDPPPQLDRSSTAAILNQTSVSVPNSHRWSQAITLTIGSVPNSPVSDSHRGSMYDPIFSDIAYDSSRPTSSPDSVDQFPRLSRPAVSHVRAHPLQRLPPGPRQDATAPAAEVTRPQSPWSLEHAQREYADLDVD
jgi:hypothetical protein